ASDKYDKLVRVTKKIFGITEENCLWMPVDLETKISLGYCFIGYNTSKEAELAIQRNNKKRLDSSQILSVNSFDDFVRFMKLSADEGLLL
ncbi:hypothetical protein MKX03_031175, partial [Papaver bracteatum]